MITFRLIALGFLLPSCLAIAATDPVAPAPLHKLQTRHAAVQIDSKGFITSLTSLKSGKQYLPADHPSAVLSLHESGQPDEQLLSPVSATLRKDKGELDLRYANGCVATVRIAANDSHFRMQLVALTPRGSIDNVVWGPLHTSISKLIGDLIGVVRDDDWAIGMLGLDDNTITGPVEPADCYGMGYYIHSSDPVKNPLPPHLKEGQWFNIGGDGVSDTAFYSHPEEYYQQVFGSGAKLEPTFGSTVVYHARDRRKSYTHLFSLLPGFPRSRPRHVVTDPLEGVDFMGSGIALYACPDDLALANIEKIIVAERLPHITIAGKWVRDPSLYSPTLYWNGPCDKVIDYAKALGIRDISRETAEFYPSLNQKWVGQVGFAKRAAMTYKEFAAQAHANGLTHGGLHTLCVFLQGGVSSDVAPIPSEHLQTVCRTKLAKDISATDTEITVTDPSFLAEKGTWTRGDDSNYLRIGNEMLRYEGITDKAPYTLTGIKRGHASTASAHRAGDEVAKLMQNCYNGFVPDIKLMLDYAEYYAQLMTDNGMDTINFDGFESTVYQHHGYYGTRVFCRRLYETYAKLNGGRYPRVTASNVFAGSWEYLNVCDVGGGDNMFNARSGRRAIEGKDIGNGFTNSYFPGTFGIQGWHSDWSLYDLENLQAKAIGWDSTYALSASSEAIEQSGEKDAMLKAFSTWQRARAAQVFSKELRIQLRDPGQKFHLEESGARAFTLYPIKEVQQSGKAGAEATVLSLSNQHPGQALQFALQVATPVSSATLTLPDQSRIQCDRKIDAGQWIICKGKQAYLADKFRKKLMDLPLARPAMLPSGDSKIQIQIPGASAPVGFALTTWTAAPAIHLPVPARMQ